MASFTEAAPPRGGRVLLIAVLMSLVALFGAAIGLTVAWNGAQDPHRSSADVVSIHP
ncbi:hypothetical protein [Sporichthya polymorpha]|uniref:hypothetical protein n=1 Tax=Sporichthya polymorpha TaxID=35751 RepID=UPI00037F4DA2|nr:hypothetical protein [Sporichthya polymorpha]